MQKDLRRNPAADRGFLEGAQPGFLRGELSNWRPAHRETGHQSLIVAAAIRKIESIAEMVLRYRKLSLRCHRVDPVAGWHRIARNGIAAKRLSS
jgi:hypothetical protein